MLLLLYMYMGLYIQRGLLTANRKDIKNKEEILTQMLYGTLKR